MCRLPGAHCLAAALYWEGVWCQVCVVRPAHRHAPGRAVPMMLICDGINQSMNQSPWRQAACRVGQTPGAPWRVPQLPGWGTRFNCQQAHGGPLSRSQFLRRLWGAQWCPGREGVYLLAVGPSEWASSAGNQTESHSPTPLCQKSPRSGTGQCPGVPRPQLCAAQRPPVGLPQTGLRTRRGPC